MSNTHPLDTDLCYLAHEMHSPLTVVQGHVQQLRWACEQGEPVPWETSLPAIERQVKRMQAAVDGLLAMVTEQVGETRRAIDFGVMVNNLLDELAHTHGRDIRRKVSAALQVEGNAYQLEMVIRNLVENAIKYSPAPSPVHITLDGDAVAVRLVVRDEGMGIAEEALPHVFTPFYRAPDARDQQHISGHGLGLALCKRIVEDHDGALIVESEPGEGAVFTVLLPRG